MTGFLLLYSIFTFNNGELRGYIFIAILFGILLYALLLSKYFTKALTYILNFLNKIIFKPIYSVLKFLQDKTKNVYSKIKVNFLTIKIKKKETTENKKKHKKVVNFNNLNSNKIKENKQKVNLKNIVHLPNPQK